MAKFTIDWGRFEKVQLGVNGSWWFFDVLSFLEGVGHFVVDLFTAHSFVQLYFWSFVFATNPVVDFFAKGIVLLNFTDYGKGEIYKSIFSVTIFPKIKEKCAFTIVEISP